MIDIRKKYKKQSNKEKDKTKMFILQKAKDRLAKTAVIKTADYVMVLQCAMQKLLGGNNDENSNNNRHHFCSLVLRLVRGRAGRHLPRRVVAHRNGGNKLHYLCSVTKGDKAMPRRRLTPEERAESLERRRRQRREYFRRYYREHREERMSQVKDWQERHREAYREYQREYQRKYTRRHGDL